MGNYSKNTWQDRVGVGLNKFTDQNNNEYEFTPNPDEITQTGTPFSASWMNHIEDGIKTIDDRFSSSYNQLQLPMAGTKILAAGKSTINDGGFVALYDAAGTLRGAITAGADDANGEYLRLYDKNGNGNIYLFQDANGGRLQLNNTSGTRTIDAGTSSSGNGFITVKNSGNANEVAIGTLSDGGGSIFLYDENGSKRLMLAAGDETHDTEYLAMYGNDGETWKLKLTTSLNSYANQSLEIASPITTTGSANVILKAWGGGDGYYLAMVTSSRDKKTDIKTIDDPEEIIKKINPVSFKDKETGEPHLGYIAEEMAEACPILAVFVDGKPTSIEYDRVNVLLLKAVQDLYRRIEELEAKL